MDDFVLWALMLGVSALGLLLIGIGAVAMYLNTRIRKETPKHRRQPKPLAPRKKPSGASSLSNPKELLPTGLFGSTSRGYVSSSSDLLPSGYRRSDYHLYGATDDDIEFWGLDQPGAPPPDVAGWAVMDLLDEMDADGDGLIDDPFDDPFL